MGVAVGQGLGRLPADLEDLPDVERALPDAIAERLRNGELLVMTPYPDMEREQIAVTAWSRIDKFPVSEYSLARVEAFIDAHMRRFNPEKF